jgi:hypothetical protein
MVPLWDRITRITRQVEEAALMRTPRKRAPSPDGILGETLRCAPDDIIDVIVLLHQAFWAGATVPPPRPESLRDDPCPVER